MSRKTASDFPQELLDLYDYYAHGLINRRTFLERAAKFTAGGITAAALLQTLSPNYALAVQVLPGLRAAGEGHQDGSNLRIRKFGEGRILVAAFHGSALRETSRTGRQGAGGRGGA